MWSTLSSAPVCTPHRTQYIFSCTSHRKCQTDYDSHWWWDSCLVCYAQADSIPRMCFAVTSYVAASAGSDVAPRGGSSCTLHLTTWLLSVVLATSYSGALVSSIASRRVTLPFSTFQEFLNDGTYRLGVIANSSIISTMRVRHIHSLTLWNFKWDKCNISKVLNYV